MRILCVAVQLLVLVVAASAAWAEETAPDMIVERMAVKLFRGVTNVATSAAEIPKQTYLTVREEGEVGYIIGPAKGIGMTLYRALLGAAEAVFFLVPQPGYYDPMITPDYVWKEWEPRKQ
jgi:putative exosortase-associated protein (TIGR04073 family)